MGRRFLTTTALLDVTSLGLAIIVGIALLPDFGAGVETVEVAPLLGTMFLGALLGSYVSARSWASGAPRPSYGRAVSIITIAVSFTALVIVTTRIYWSRPHFVATTIGWLALALAHRAVRRRRPWSENIVVVTREKELLEDLRAAPHANVVDALDPGGEPPTRPYSPDTLLAVDLRAVLSDTMAQYVASLHLAGCPMRGFTSVYEEHTGRMPIVHLMEGWELTEPLDARSPYVSLKRFIDVALVLLTSPITLTLSALIAVVIAHAPSVQASARTGRRARSGRQSRDGSVS